VTALIGFFVSYGLLCVFLEYTLNGAAHEHGKQVKFCSLWVGF